MSDARINVSFKPEFEQILEDVNSGKLTKEKILREPDCKKAIHGAMAYNFLFYNEKKSIAFQEIYSIQDCLNDKTIFNVEPPSQEISKPRL